MSDLLDRCREYGADVEGAMERMVGDEELFESCLELFSQDKEFDELKCDMEEGEYKKAFEPAHALKGVAGNLGLTPLFEAISNLVESLRSEDYSHVTEQYHEVVVQQERVNGLLKG